MFKFDKAVIKMLLSSSMGHNTSGIGRVWLYTTSYLLHALLTYSIPPNARSDIH